MKEVALYQISTSMYEGVLEIVVTGKISEFDIPRLQKEFSSYRSSGSYRLLIDMRALMIDTGILYHVRRPDNANGMTAVVGLSDMEQWQSLCNNLTKHTPMMVKYFCNIDAARDWLKGAERHRTMIFDKTFNNHPPGDHSLS